MADLDNLVYQTSTTTGTGNFTMVSVSGYRLFSAAFPSSSSSQRFYYAIRHTGANEYEIGEGYLSGGALVRHTVLKSSNSDTLVNFTAGTKDIVNDVPAALQAGLVTLSADLAAKVPVTRTINGYALSSNVTLTNTDVGAAATSHTHAISDVTGLQTSLDGKVDENSAITGSTKTKITYDAKGLVTSGADATTADISDSTNKRYVTDAQLVVISNTSGTNTGDQTNITGNAGTVTTINGHITAGTNVTITGSGTTVSPYNISSSGGGTPAGLDTYVQFNDGGSFGGDSGLTYNKTSDALTVNGLVYTPIVQAHTSAGLTLEAQGGGDVLVIGSGGGVNATAYGGWNYDAATASTLASFGVSKTLSSLSTATYPSLTEVSYVKGVTSAIQTQLDAKQPLDSDLTALAGNSTNGLWARTGAGAGSARTITAGTGISVTDGNGVSGNPTIASTITQYTDSDALAAVAGAGYITSVNVDGKSVTGDGNTIPLESHTRYDQAQSGSYALADSDNDKVFDDTSGSIDFSINSIAAFPFSATFVNIKGNDISINVSGCNVCVGGVEYTTITSVHTLQIGSSLKMRIHLDPTKVYLEPFGEWEMLH